jgi:hypothetical protein
MLAVHRLSLVLVVVAGIAVGLAVVGCGGTPAEPSKASQGTEQMAVKADQESAPAAAKSKAESETPKGLAELSPEDRAAAEAQRVCPVSGELLGEMGKPVKITVKGRTVFLCCSGCEDEIQKNPDKYLAKLPKQE